MARRCSAIKGNGERCHSVITGVDGLCYAHSPQYSKGSKRGGHGRHSVELARLQTRFEELAEKVLDGEVERGIGAVVGQLLNGARACIRDSLTARQVEEFDSRLTALEQLTQASSEARNGRRTPWG